MPKDNRNKVRRALLLAAVVIIVLILLLLRSCGDDKTVIETETLPAVQAPDVSAPAQEEMLDLPEKSEATTEEPSETPAATKDAPAAVSVRKREAADAGIGRKDAAEQQFKVTRQPPRDPATEDENLWAKTLRANTEQAYRNYLSKYPDGKHAREAEEVLRSGMYPAGRNVKGYEEFRNIKTGTLFVLIPAGEFWMGSPEGEGEPDEHPRHKVYLDAYYIGKYEVTIEQYEKFCSAAEHTVPEKPWLTEQGDHPIVYPTWEDAKAYCDWAGLRLPTEAEWEKAARGNTDTTYYWGDKPAREMANFLGTGGKDKFSITSPVGSFPPNGYGACDMAGNIWEWCSDWYKSDYYEHEMEEGLIKNPKGPRKGEFKVIRGGSWNYEEENMRPAFRTRLEPKHWYDYNGFRAALDYMPN